MDKQALRTGYMLAIARLRRRVRREEGPQFEEWLHKITHDLLVNETRNQIADEEFREMEAMLVEQRDRWGVVEHRALTAEDHDFIRRVEAKRDRILAAEKKTQRGA